MAEAWGAEDQDHAIAAAKAFAAACGAKDPKAVAKILDDLDVLLAFYDYPAQHCIHLRRPTRSSRPSRPSGCASASPRAPAPGQPPSPWPLKLIESAQRWWRALNAPTSSPSSAPALAFKNGKLVERPDESCCDAHAA